MTALPCPEGWSAPYFGNSELYEALRPLDRCNVSVSGGLRLPDRGGWLDGFGPLLTVIGFGDTAHLTISQIRYSGSEVVVLDREQPANEPMSVEWPGSGTYRVDALCSGQTARRLVTIAPWQAVRLSGTVPRERVTMGRVQICGAAIE